MKKFRLQANGWAIEASAHKLTTSELELVRQAMAANDEQNQIGGSLEEILPEYECFRTNLWQSGQVPLIENSRFFLIGEGAAKEVEIDNRKNAAETSEYLAPTGDGSIAVYVEESKGLTAVWDIEAEIEPDPQKLELEIGKIVVGGECFEYIYGINYDGSTLEPNYEAECLDGKGSYTIMV